MRNLDNFRLFISPAFDHGTTANSTLFSHSENESEP